MVIFFAQNLRYFRANFFFANFWNEFCASLCNFFCAKPEIFFCEFLCMKQKEFYAIFFAQFALNRKYYAKRIFLSKLTRFEILCTELNNWRFIQLLNTKKLFTKSMLKLLSIGYFLLQSSNYSKINWDLRDWETWQYLNPIKLISSDPTWKDDNSQRYP